MNWKLRRRFGIGLLVLGGGLDLAGLAALIYGVLVPHNVWIALGQLWFQLDVASLNFTQAITQRYIHPLLWDPVAVTILLLPAVLVFWVPGLALIVWGMFLSKQRPTLSPLRYISR
jgi:hypothetical protein